MGITWDSFIKSFKKALMNCKKRPLDALITLDALLYALLYLFGLAFAFYPLVKWCRENEGFSWPWPHVQSEKKRIKELRREQESQEKAEQDSDKK